MRLLTDTTLKPTDDFPADVRSSGLQQKLFKKEDRSINICFVSEPPYGVNSIGKFVLIHSCVNDNLQFIQDSRWFLHVHGSLFLAYLNALR